MSIDQILTKEELTLREKVQDFVKWVPRQLLLDMDSDKVKYPKEFIREAGKRNLLGLRFDKKWGGAGMPWTSEMVALEEVGILGTSLGCLYSLFSIVGEAIHVFGTEEQKERFLIPMLKGEIGVAEGLTEPRGGSDFFAATTKAVRKGDMFYLSGQKRFVVGAEGADLILVYAKVEGIDDAKKAMTAFLVERGPGVEVEHVYGLMGTRGGGTGRLVFKDAAVPLKNVLGGEAGIGNGTRVFHQMMVPERLTSAGGAVGMARGAFEVAARYADKRKAFGRKIRSFEAVSAKVSDSLTLLDASRAINYMAAKTADAPVSAGQIRQVVSEAKKFSTESAWKVVNHAMQIMGGIGYTNVYPVEKMLRDIRLITIWTGTNEIMDLVIQHEFYKAFLTQKQKSRDIEPDAEGAELPDEKIYNDDE
ncbi:acyl-CoA/acyl-ACP dehydrogenase [Candidatus Sulfidibacterium hydrothermale]|uniref:acyl-CoA dehydrogenase family protein n=1 Tax=Candidatus Sulfidibacterium hydrothermale TaxID=2875962 RepID=UPI001F0A6ED6|nr:acyl-CoA dehydrogenase family protein [Candidatus Sulfidibacterium hydrothermale]UBM62667.1 acyl-CoA/acyl-ACP dehydrogenase [Candidatus Sulfidibacterium hydrothermale]